MPLRNRIKEFIQSQGITPYQFWKSTGLSKSTAYRLCGDPECLVSGTALEKICDCYQVQPSEIVYWVPLEGGEQES